TTTLFTVSPAVRVAVNAPVLSVPDVCSEPDDVPFTVCDVLPLASPLVVRSLDELITEVELSRRVCVPETDTCVLMVLVVTLSNADCATPFLSVKAIERVTVRPRSVSGVQVKRPVAVLKVQLLVLSAGSPMCPWPKSWPSPGPPRK